MLGDALGPDLRRALIARQTRSRAADAVLAATWRAGRDAGRRTLCRDDRLVVLPGGIAGSQRWQPQSVRLRGRACPCGREGRRRDPCEDAGANTGEAEC